MFWLDWTRARFGPSCFSIFFCWAGASDEPSFGLSFFSQMLLESRGQEKQSFQKHVQGAA